MPEPNPKFPKTKASKPKPPKLKPLSPELKKWMSTHNPLPPPLQIWISTHTSRARYLDLLGRRRQETPLRQNSFFTHLTQPIRMLIYRQMTLFPSSGHQLYMGMALSCRKAAEEMIREALCKLHDHLFKMEKTQLPKAITSKDSLKGLKDLTIGTFRSAMALGNKQEHDLEYLTGLNLNTLRIHFLRDWEHLPIPATVYPCHHKALFFSPAAYVVVDVYNLWVKLLQDYVSRSNGGPNRIIVSWNFLPQDAPLSLMMYTSSKSLDAEAKVLLEQDHPEAVKAGVGLPEAHLVYSWNYKVGMMDLRFHRRWRPVKDEVVKNLVEGIKEGSDLRDVEYERTEWDGELWEEEDEAEMGNRRLVEEEKAVRGSLFQGRSGNLGWGSGSYF